MGVFKSISQTVLQIKTLNSNIWVYTCLYGWKSSERAATVIVIAVAVLPVSTSWICNMTLQSWTTVIAIW